MPQLDFSTYASQIFWLAIVFTFLYFILAKYTLPSIREVLQNRQLRIANDLKKAESLKKDAESAEADFTSVLVEARQKATDLLNKARSESEERAAARQSNLEKSFAKQNKEAEQRVANLKQEAISEMLPVTAKVSAKITKELLGISVTAKQAEKVVKELSKDLYGV